MLLGGDMPPVPPYGYASDYTSCCNQLFLYSATTHAMGIIEKCLENCCWAGYLWIIFSGSFSFRE